MKKYKYEDISGCPTCYVWVVYYKIFNKGFTNSSLFESEYYPSDFRIVGIFYTDIQARQLYDDFKTLADMENKKRGYEYMKVYETECKLDGKLYYVDRYLHKMSYVFKMSGETIKRLLLKFSDSLWSMLERD